MQGDRNGSLSYSGVGLYAAALTVLFFLLEHHVGISTWPGFGTSREELYGKVSEGSTVRQIAYVLLGALGLLSLVRSRLRITPKGALGAVLVVWIAWAFASVIWSEDPIQSGKRLTILLLVVTAATGIAHRFTEREVWIITSLVTGAFLLIGIGAEVAFETLRPFDPTYRFAGTLHPNGQGVNLALLALSCMTLSGSSRGARRVLLFSVAGLAFAFLLLTKSRHAIACGVVASAAFGLVRLWVDRPAKAMVAVFASLAVILATAFTNVIVGFARQAVSLGRNDSELGSLTGRVPLWTEQLLPYTLERPITGFGYGAFWVPDRIWSVSGASGWAVMDAHSIYVEMVLSLGLVGLAGFVLMLGLTATRGLFEASPDYAQRGVYGSAFALCLFGACHGLLEIYVWSGGFLTLLIMTVIVRHALLGGEHGAGTGSPPSPYPGVFQLARGA